MLRSKFIGTVLVIVLGVNIGAWTLSVATAPVPLTASTSVQLPISNSAIDAQSQAASVVLSQSQIMNDPYAVDTKADTIVATTSTSTSHSITY